MFTITGDAFADFIIISYIGITIIYNTVEHRWKEYFREGYDVMFREFCEMAWNWKIVKIIRIFIALSMGFIADFVSFSYEVIKGER